MCIGKMCLPRDYWIFEWINSLNYNFRLKQCENVLLSNWLLSCEKCVWISNENKRIAPKACVIDGFVPSICCAPCHHLNWSKRFNFHVLISMLMQRKYIQRRVVCVCVSTPLFPFIVIKGQLFFFFLLTARKLQAHHSGKRRYKPFPIILMNVVNNFRYTFSSFAVLLSVGLSHEACTC